MDLSPGETQTGAVIKESVTDAWKVNGISQIGEKTEGAEDRTLGTPVAWQYKEKEESTVW